jgi:predicted site-specific integrase-resolvase
MTLAQGEGIRLLTVEAAAQEAGVDVEAFRNWAALGLVTARDTPVGPRYALHEIRDLLEHGPRFTPQPRWLTTGQAARVLGVQPHTLMLRAGEGRVPCVRTPEGKRRYAEPDMQAIAAEREKHARSWWPEPELPHLPR